MILRIITFLHHFVNSYQYLFAFLINSFFFAKEIPGRIFSLPLESEYSLCYNGRKLLLLEGGFP